MDTGTPGIDVLYHHGTLGMRPIASNGYFGVTATKYPGQDLVRRSCRKPNLRVKVRILASEMRNCLRSKLVRGV